MWARLYERALVAELGNAFRVSDRHTEAWQALHLARVRGFIKSRLGTKSERLPQFGVAPIRQRRARVPLPKPPELAIPQPE